jgi:hypothetical protein
MLYTYVHDSSKDTKFMMEKKQKESGLMISMPAAGTLKK